MLGLPQGTLCSCFVASRQTVCRFAAVVDVAMATSEELVARLQTLENEFARMNTQAAGASSSRAPEPSVAVPAASTNVRLPSAVGDVPHVAENPVPRAAHLPKTPVLFDMRMDRGYLAVSQGGSPAMLHEYRWSASAFSYFKDTVVEMERIIPALQDEAQRRAFSVLLAQFKGVLALMEQRLDYLKVFGEHKFREPGLVAAVENAIAGKSDLPVTSSTVLDAVASFRDKKVTTAIKQGASRDYTAEQQGRGSGRGRRDRTGQQQQQQQGGRHPYNTRQQAADGAAGER